MEAIYEAGGDLVFAGTLHDELPSQSRAHPSRSLLSRAQDPVAEVRNINDGDAVEGIKAAGFDWLFIIGWSQIARSEVLQGTRLGVLGCILRCCP